MAVEYPCSGRNIESIPRKHAQVMGLWVTSIETMEGRGSVPLNGVGPQCWEARLLPCETKF